MIEVVVDRFTSKYLVQWKGYGPEHNQWLAGSMVEDLAALDVYEREQGISDDS